jgi:hypothetical protein
MRASKYANVVKEFLKNHIRLEHKLFKKELFVHYKDEEIFYWYVFFKLYKFE